MVSGRDAPVSHVDGRYMHFYSDCWDACIRPIVGLAKRLRSESVSQSTSGIGSIGSSITREQESPEGNSKGRTKMTQDQINAIDAAMKSVMDSEAAYAVAQASIAPAKMALDAAHAQMDAAVKAAKDW